MINYTMPITKWTQNILIKAECSVFILFYFCVIFGFISANYYQILAKIRSPGSWGCKVFFIQSINHYADEARVGHMKLIFWTPSPSSTRLPLLPSTPLPFLSPPSPPATHQINTVCNYTHLILSQLSPDIEES